MILIAYGTRPEIIKLFPLVHEFKRRNMSFRTLFTGQHPDLYQDVKDLMPEPDYILSRDKTTSETLCGSFQRIFSSFEALLGDGKFRCVLIQGDTTTACAIAQGAFYNQVKVGHIEAGLRTYDVENPFPEEANRRIISQLACFNFAPTPRALSSLQKEGARNVYLTGNTIVDALNFFDFERKFENTVLITIHRRENHHQIKDIFLQLDRVAGKYPDFKFIFPIHPNPNVRKHRRLLTHQNIHVIDPVGYPEMLEKISRASFIISDSGGLQEEAVYFGKKILIVRKTTERPETIESGFGRLVDVNIAGHIEWALKTPSFNRNNPFGDGNSSKNIADILIENLYH